MPANKNKTVNVTVNGKSFTFRFKPVSEVNLKPEDLICEVACPLNSVCDKLKDPRDLNDETACFNDFCLAIGDPDKSAEEILNDESQENLMPDIEDVLKFAEETNHDIYQEIIDSDPYVKLADVIDCVCGEEGFDCSFYSKDHSNCTSKNGLCILKRFFKV